MAKDYTKMAQEIIRAVGGPENIISVSNCMTRLRFVLRDDTIPDGQAIRSIEGVSGSINKGGQYQVIIGTNVTNVLPFVQRALGQEKEDAAPADQGRRMAEQMRVLKKESPLNRLFKVIQGCLMPLIGPMCGVGILKGILTILTTVGVLQSTDGTYVLLYNAADAFMLLLPVFVAYSSAKVFGGSPTLMMAIGAALVAPGLVSLVGGETPLTFLRIPVELINYQNTFFPAIVACWVGAKLEQLCKKYLPEILHLMFVPLIVLTITVPVTYLVVGPIITLASNGVANFVVAIMGINATVAGLVIGAVWQLVVLTGLHGAMIPLIVNNIITLGADPINGILTMTVFAVTGVSLGYGLKVKDQNRKSMALGNVVSGLCGVTEPIIYSIALPKFKEFVCAMIAGGLAGGILGFFGVQFITFAGSGVFALPGMIEPTGVGMNFYIACGGAVVAFVVAAVLSFIVTKPED